MSFPLQHEAQGAPVDAPLEITSRQVGGGWLIRGLLMDAPGLMDCRLALRMGYQATRWSTAGLAMSKETQQLLLVQWHPQLPGAQAMARQLEGFAQGLEIWREALARARAPGRGAASNDAIEQGGRELRIRRQILGTPAGALRQP